MKAKAAHTKFEMLAVLMRMRQIANHPSLVENGAADSSGKLEAFFDVLDEAMAGGHRSLVFSQFVSMLSILRRELEKRGIRYCYLDGSTKDRLGECRKFNQSDIPVFLISLHAGGTGLNLTGADTVIHFDPWWNPAVENQATDRAHRIGQKKKVCVVKLISEDSVEERVLKLQEKKSLVIDATVGATDDAIVSKMSFEDLKSIVGL
jgi:SNF2 family DNA or RNA helicase